VATTTETHSRWWAAALALFASALVLAGCPGRELLDTQEEMRDELEMLRARLVRLEADIAGASVKIKDLTDREEKLEKDAEGSAEPDEVPPDTVEEPAPADGALRQAPLDPARGRQDAAVVSSSNGDGDGADRTDVDGSEDEEDESDPAAERGVPVDNFTRSVQTALRRAGYEPGPVDGKAGAMTRRAIREFQKDSNLPETGVADPATWELLRRYLE
jgi:hypothetical protein